MWEKEVRRRGSVEDIETFSMRKKRCLREINKIRVAMHKKLYGETLHDV